MNVFFSWSGSVSHRVAHELADWLPYVVQAITPFISSEHIDKGERWNEELMAYLNGTSYGVICITRHNMNATWMNFEAGALSKALHRPDVAHALSRSNVVPFLFGVDSTEISGPLEQFQATAYRQDETANK